MHYLRCGNSSHRFTVTKKRFPKIGNRKKKHVGVECIGAIIIIAVNGKLRCLSRDI